MGREPMRNRLRRETLAPVQASGEALYKGRRTPAATMHACPIVVSIHAGPRVCAARSWGRRWLKRYARHVCARRIRKELRDADLPHHLLRTARPPMPGSGILWPGSNTLWPTDAKGPLAMHNVGDENVHKTMEIRQGRPLRENRRAPSEDGCGGSKSENLVAGRGGWCTASSHIRLRARNSRANWARS